MSLTDDWKAGTLLLQGTEWSHLRLSDSESE